MRGVILGISDPEDFSAQTTDEGGRLVHRLELWDGDVGRLVNTLPVLDLIKEEPNQSASIIHNEVNKQSYISEDASLLLRLTLALRKLLHSCSTL